MGNRKVEPQTAAQWLWAHEPMRWRRVYSGRREQVSAARRLAQTMFAGVPCEHAVVLAASELATNAIRHSHSGAEGGWFGLELVYANPAYVAVTDLGGSGVPTVLPEGYTGPCGEEGGRGLLTLYELATEFGVRGSSDQGHTVWVALDLACDLNIAPRLDVSLAS
ncbi:ATP-binding protein [Spirillospora sp. NPDC127200]